MVGGFGRLTWGKIHGRVGTSVQLHRLASRGGTILVVKPMSIRVRWQRKQYMGVCGGCVCV